MKHANWDHRSSQSFGFLADEFWILISWHLHCLQPANEGGNYSPATFRNEFFKLNYAYQSLSPEERHSLFRLTAQLVSHGTLLLQALCASILDRASANDSPRVNLKGCASAGVAESSSADEDEASAFLPLQAFLAPLFSLLFPEIKIRLGNAQDTHGCHEQVCLA